MTAKMLLGPVMGDVEGLVLTEADRVRLLHPLMGGVILFARNYQNHEQLKVLTAEIRALRAPRLMIVVDHEGGRVQRFREGFTAIPPMRALGARWQTNPQEAKALAHDVGVVIGTELVAHGLDFSFAPVLDLDWGESGVIGDRAFGRDPATVAALAGGVIAGLRAVGAASCAKHFPGHGFVRADSHHEVPRDAGAHYFRENRPNAGRLFGALAEKRIAHPVGLSGRDLFRRLDHGRRVGGWWRYRTRHGRVERRLRHGVVVQ